MRGGGKNVRMLKNSGIHQTNTFWLLELERNLQQACKLGGHHIIQADLLNYMVSMREIVHNLNAGRWRTCENVKKFWNPPDNTFWLLELERNLQQACKLGGHHIIQTDLLNYMVSMRQTVHNLSAGRWRTCENVKKFWNLPD